MRINGTVGATASVGTLATTGSLVIIMVSVVVVTQVTTVSVSVRNNGTTGESQTTQSLQTQQISSVLSQSITTVPQFFSAIHAFTATINESTSGASTTGTSATLVTQSYSYIGSPTINGTAYTEVSVTCTGTVLCQYPSPYTFWIAADGSIPLISYGGSQYKYGYTVNSGGASLLLEALLTLSTSAIFTGQFNGYFSLKATGQYAAGSTQIPTETFGLSAPYAYAGGSLTRADLTFGILPGNYSILLNYILVTSASGETGTLGLSVASLTLA